jgi:mannose/fructose-specific phosphotransferase system component IIA
MAERMAFERPFRIVVASHAELAAAILGSAAMINGGEPIEDAVSVCLEEGESLDSYKARLEAALGDDGRPVLLLVDFQGGSPYLASKWLAKQFATEGGPELAVVCGLNLGMLLEAFLSLDSIDVDAVAGLVAAGRSSVVDVSERAAASGA